MCILMEFAGGGDLATVLAKRWWEATRMKQHQLLILSSHANLRFLQMGPGILSQKQPFVFSKKG